MSTKIHLFDHSSATHHFEAVAVIFDKDDIGTEMYIIVSGEVSLMMGDELAILGEGDPFGEMALIDEGNKRSLTAVAKSDCSLVAVDEKRFQFMVQQTPAFALTMLRILAERLREWHGRR